MIPLLRKFAQGLVLPFLGWLVLRRHSGFWRYLLLPVFLTGIATLALVGGVFWGGWELSAFGSEWFSGRWWSALARGAYYIGLVAVGFGVVVGASLAVWNVIYSLFLGALCQKLEQALGTPAGELRGLGVAGDFSDALKNVGEVAGVALAVLLLPLFPVVGPGLAVALGWYWNARVLGRQVLEVPWSARGVRRAERKLRAQRVLPQVLGVGTVVLLVGWIPFLGAMVIALATVGCVQWNLSPETRKLLV